MKICILILIVDSENNRQFEYLETNDITSICFNNQNICSDIHIVTEDKKYLLDKLLIDWIK